MKKRKIVLGESSEIIAGGFARILENSAIFEVVATVEKFERIEEKLILQKPEILVLNPSLPGIVRVDSITSAFPDFPNLTIVALVHNYVEQSALKRFHGIIEINDSRQSIENKLKEALSGREQEDEEEMNDYELSERETEVLVSVAKGLQNKEIADKLSISVHTVISHRKNIVAKTGIKSVAGLTVYALLHNLITESDIIS